MPEWTYPRRLDAIPAFFGSTQPDHGFFGVLHRGCAARGDGRAARRAAVDVSGAHPRARRAVRDSSVGAQAKGGGAAAAAASRGETHEETFDFYRANRPAWLDVHLGYALLCPAGAVGGDGASWWLLLPPAFMLFRFVGHRFDAMATGSSRRRRRRGLRRPRGALLLRLGRAHASHRIPSRRAAGARRRPRARRVRTHVRVLHGARRASPGRRRARVAR